MRNNKSAYRYETPYSGLFEMTQCWTDGTVTLQVNEIKTKYDIHHMNPYTFLNHR